MMKKFLFVFGLIQVFSFNCWGQSVFNNIYYSDTMATGGARANTVIQTSDNNFFIAGTTNNLISMYGIKVDFTGDKLWSFSYDLGNGGADYINSIIETNNGNYILGGATSDISVMSSAAFLIKLKPNGDTVWVSEYGLANKSERCSSIKQTSDGGFVFCGLRINTTGNNADVYLVKTDSTGNLQWEKTFGGTEWDNGLSIEITAEGGYMIFGNTYSYGIGLYNMYLIKTDSLGNLIWQKTYGGSLKDYGSSITKTIDGNYALAGGTYIATDTIAAYVSKIDTAGTVLWEKRFKGNFNYTEFTAIKELPTGELVVSGDQQGDTLSWLWYGITKKLDANGDVIWEKQYKYFSADSIQHYFYAMDVCNDGGLVMAGMTVDYRQGANPTNGMWLVKTDAYGCDSTACLSVSINKNESVQKDELLIYPNPSQSKITIEFNAAEKANTLVEIKNVLGQAVYSEIFKNRNDKQAVSIDLSAFSNGIYVVRVQSESKISSKKFVKE